MPNTLAHIGLQVLGQRALGIGPRDFGLVLCGCVIPDLPWILQRVISGFEISDPLRLFAYSSIQSSLFISLILAAAVSLLLRESVRAFLVIGISCFFHLLLDALQIKWSNGVILLDPFDWATVNWGKAWPENPVVYVASFLGAAVILYALSTSRDFSVRFGATRIQRFMAGIMIIVWLALPLAFVRKRKWLRRLQACEASGKSFTVYAAEHGFPVRELYDAKKTLVNKGVLPRTQQKRFQRVQTATMLADTKWRIQLPNGVSVEFSGSVDGSALSSVLTTVAHLE